jgi:1,4-dihydroxy-2-naphthoate octaprenyltransferase
LPVRLGHAGTAILYAAIHVFAVGIVVWLTARGALPIAAPLVPVVLLVLALKAARAIRYGVKDRAGMTGAIEATLGIHTVGSLWLSGSALYVAFWGGF